MINTKKTRALFATAALVIAGAAQAGPVYIHDINMEVRESTYSVTGLETVPSILAEFGGGNLVCNVGLAEVNLVGSVQTCGGPNGDIATLITIDFSQSSNTHWQIGPDWGRGGMIWRQDATSYVDDYWWGQNWNNTGEVITYQTGGSGVLSFLGFEGCCGGPMSIRYSSDQGNSWTTAAVNVSEPGTLALLGLGLLAMGARRRAKS